ncbi:MAG: CHAT domain-containing protein, partial [Saprospiraceae bacterium]|nr:CHAT domain-containing protein [Saprospiraceae bacterium]
QTLIELLPLFRPSNPNQLPVLDELTAISPWILDALLGHAKTRKAQYRFTNDPENLKSALSAYELAIAYQNRIKLRFADDLSKFQFNSYYNTTCESALQIAFELYRMFQTPEYAARAFSLSEQTKAVVLAEGLYKKQLKQVVGVPKELLEAERTAEVKIANFEMQLSETEDQEQLILIKDSLFAARREKEALEYRVKTNFPAYADALYSWQATTKLEDVQNDLPEDAALITYFLGDHSFCTFLIASDTFWMQEKPLPEEFITVLADFHHSISDWQYANDSSAVSGNVFLKNSHVLYQWLLQEPLAFTPAKRLFIVPDGRLGSMPFELLLTQAYQGSWIDRDVPFLLKERTVSYRFSARKNAQFNKNEGAYGWGGFGLEGDDATLSALNQPAGYTGLRNLGPLPFADDEVLAVHNLLGGAFWLNQEATRENFVQNAEKFGILHLATHGVVDEQNALRTRLLFHQSSTGADPFVYAADLYNLQLTAGLSVLSACGSGTGSWQKGEGVMSLARAFAFAGCPSIVMSLWNISDQSTSDLMVDFYKHLKAGVEKDEALRLAKLEYLKRVSPEYAKPIYWAAFVPIGEMDALPSAYFPVTRPWWWYGGLIGLSVFVLWVLYRCLKPSGTP